jgi:hypothetical protein
LNTDDIASPVGAGKTQITYVSSNELIAALCDARDRLDEGVELLNEALDLREQLEWGVLDLDHARGAVSQLGRAVLVHRRSRI